LATREPKDHKMKDLHAAGPVEQRKRGADLRSAGSGRLCLPERVAGSAWTRQRSATPTQVAVYLALCSFNPSIDNRMNCFIVVDKPTCPSTRRAVMIRHVKRYLAIRSYVRRLGSELVRRFGKRGFYSVEQVTQAVQRGKFSAAFIAYAHATFCSQADFDAHYGPLGVSCSYQGLRGTVGRRYLSGRIDFDAATVITKYRHIDYNRGDYYESGQGE